MRPDPNVLAPPEDLEGRVCLKVRRGVPWLYAARGVFMTLPIWIVLTDAVASPQVRGAVAVPFACASLFFVAEALRIAFGWAYRLGPERMEIHQWWFLPPRQVAAADLLGIVRGKGGRARLVVRDGEREALVTLPLAQLSVASSRAVVDWAHRHAKDPTTRLLKGAADLTDTTGANY